MHFQLISEIQGIEPFAHGRGIRELTRLQRIHGRGKWLKRFGFARIRLDDGSEDNAELHWYEASSKGRKELKIKRLLEALP